MLVRLEVGPARERTEDEPMRPRLVPMLELLRLGLLLTLELLRLLPILELLLRLLLMLELLLRLLLMLELLLWLELPRLLLMLELLRLPPP